MKTSTVSSAWLCGVVAISASIVAVASAADNKTLGPDRSKFDASRSQAIAFLKSSQREDGSWTASDRPGISALAVAGLLENGVAADDPIVARGLAHLESHIKADGGIYFTESLHRNYETCIAMMAFHGANKAGRYDDRIAAAQKFLRGLQWDKGEGLEDSDPAFGGAGYGKHQRPDLSNTQFLVEAMITTGVEPDDPAIQAALAFVSRSQNFDSSDNNTPFAKLVRDGGFYYTPAAGGSSQAGVTANGGLRSYGSMTYAGLKSMIYAGLNSDDDRVQAAFSWIQQNYTLQENPGMGQQGVFYYYHTFAKAMGVLEADYVVDPDGKRHDWRRELTDKLFALQRGDGSWLNTQAERWEEGDPNLATAYVLLALRHCEPKQVADQE